MGLHLPLRKRNLVGSRTATKQVKDEKTSHPRAPAATPDHGACIPSKKDRMKNIYVGNLDFNVSEDELRQAFAAYGQVDTVTILKDRDTGQPRGFGFVEMANDEEAEKAINGINGTQLGSRVLIHVPCFCHSCSQKLSSVPAPFFQYLFIYAKSSFFP